MFMSVGLLCLSAAVLSLTLRFSLPLPASQVERMLGLGFYNHAFTAAVMYLSEKSDGKNEDRTEGAMQAYRKKTAFLYVLRTS